MTSKSLKPTLTRELEPIFDLERVLGLVDDFFIESDEEAEAKITEIGNGQNCLTVCKLDRLERTRTFSVYVYPEEDEIYKLMDAAFRTSLLKDENTSEFWDMWNSMISILECGYLITTEVFEL